MSPSDHTSPLHRKYQHLARVVANLDAAQVTHMFRSSRDPMAFYPATGLYAYEFALGYVLNKVGRRAAGRARAGVQADAVHVQAGARVRRESDTGC
jgi:hypothetical protein